VYGVAALWNREFTQSPWLPPWFTGRWVAFSWSMLITAGTIALVTAMLGRSPRECEAEFHESGWLDRSREELKQLPAHPFPDSVPAWANPTAWATLLMLVSTWLIFITFW